MAAPPAERRFKAQVLDLLERVPTGRVVTVDRLAEQSGAIPQVIVTVLASLTDEERARVPWHRAVAKGGAIGRGPHRDCQFARLVREGIPVSPAGIVQDMAHVAVTEFSAAPGLAERDLPSVAAPPARRPLGRSRGMKDRPG